MNKLTHFDKNGNAVQIDEASHILEAAGLDRTTIETLK